MPRILVHRLRDEFDWVLFSLVTVIALSGVVNLYSTGLASDAPDLYLTQIYWLVFGACCAFAVTVITSGMDTYCLDAAFSCYCWCSWSAQRSTTPLVGFPWGSIAFSRRSS